MKPHIGIECGQRFWRWRSWQYRPRLRLLRSEYVRGFAVGPLMVWVDAR